MILSVAQIIVKKTFVSFKDIFILSNVLFYSYIATCMNFDLLWPYKYSFQFKINFVTTHATYNHACRLLVILTNWYAFESPKSGMSILSHLSLAATFRSQCSRIGRIQDLLPWWRPGLPAIHTSARNEPPRVLSLQYIKFSLKYISVNKTKILGSWPLDYYVARIIRCWLFWYENQCFFWY